MLSHAPLTPAEAEQAAGIAGVRAEPVRGRDAERLLIVLGSICP